MPDDTIMTLHAQGLSAREIGAIVGKTRNAVIGYIWKYKKRGGPPSGPPIIKKRSTPSKREKRYPCSTNAHPLVKETMLLVGQSGRSLRSVCGRSGVTVEAVFGWRKLGRTPSLFMLGCILQELGCSLSIQRGVSTLPHTSTWLRKKNTPGY